MEPDPKMTSRPDRLFVYGTLLAVAQHPLGDLLRAKARLLGPGHIQARLYIASEVDDQGPNTYPGAVPSADPADKVFGEVWEITDKDALYPVFDRYEACTEDWPEPHEFLLRSVPVTLETGTQVWAGSYLYAWDTSRCELVPSGRFSQVAPDVR